MPNAYKSKLSGYVVCVLHNLHVWTFYLNFAILTKNVLICFRSFGMGGQDLQKVREPTD